METATQKLTFEEFQEQYRNAERAYEFWDGDARPKSMPTIIHGLLQKVIMLLLDKAGFKSAPEVELRIISEFHPLPDVIATKRLCLEKYPTTGWNVVVEVLSEDDSFQNVRDHCENYQASGFGKIYLVDPSNRSVSEWKNGGLAPIDHLAGVPAGDIWSQLDRELKSAEKAGE